MSLEEVAMGFIKVANETMCRPIRALTQVLLITVLKLYEIIISLKKTVKARL